jgi:catechol 2,3-dioxygenase-like lactoylglutathione lyase family enzyme
MPVRLHHIVVDTCDLPRLARFWAQALGWRILSEREREIVIGSDDSAPVGVPARSGSPTRPAPPAVPHSNK